LRSRIIAGQYDGESRRTAFDLHQSFDSRSALGFDLIANQIAV